jgi:hypothetical protein
VQQLINNICQIAYADIRTVTMIESRLTKRAYVTATWLDLPVSRDNTFTVVKGYNSAREVEYAVTIAASLKLPVLTDGLYILKVSLNDGTELIIGDVDLPVRLPESHQLAGKSISIQHTSWHYPYQLAPDPGSASAGSGL